MSETPVARWESKSGKHYVNIYQDRLGYYYEAPDAGGSFGHLSEAEAVAQIEHMIEIGVFQPVKLKTPMHRVVLQGGK